MLTRIFLRPSADKPEEKSEETQVVICGDYVCWRPPYEFRIQVINIKDMTTNFRSPYDYSLPQSKKVVDLTCFFDKTTIISGSRLMIQVESCSPLYALHGTSDEKFSEQRIISKSNTIQVSIGCRGIFYDLDSPVPICHNEIPAMNHLFD